MKLTETQIQELFKFTQQHYVNWYDVQTELVDHLANGIEAQWEENPELPFKKALEKEFKKFGIMGFSDVIEEKTKALNKHYRKLVWKYFKTYFKLPKIILTLVLIFIFYRILIYVDTIFWSMLISCAVLMIVPLIFMYNLQKRIKFIKKETGKTWLIDTTVIQLGGLMHVFNIAIYLPIFLDLERHPLSNLALFAVSTSIVLFALVLYVSMFVVSPKLRGYVAKQHPDYIFT